MPANHVDKPKEVESRLDVTMQLFARGDFDGVITVLEEALRTGVQSSEVHQDLGVAYFRKGLCDTAISHYEQAIKIDPTNAAAFNNLGNALNALGRSEEALTQYERAVAINPNCALGYYNISVVLVQLGRKTEAEKKLRKSIELNDKDPKAHHNLGMLLCEKAFFGEALMEFGASAGLGYEPAVGNYKGVLMHILDRSEGRDLRPGQIQVETLDASQLYHLPDFGIIMDRRGNIVQSNPVLFNRQNILARLSGF